MLATSHFCSPGSLPLIPHTSSWGRVGREFGVNSGVRVSGSGLWGEISSPATVSLETRWHLMWKRVRSKALFQTETNNIKPSRGGGSQPRWAWSSGNEPSMEVMSFRGGVRRAWSRGARGRPVSC